MSKRAEFIPPIELPDGTIIRTFEDAGRYIARLPRKEFETAHWQSAGRQVVAGIEGHTFEMIVRISFVRALSSLTPGTHAPPLIPRKTGQFRAKKRNPWRT